MNFIMNVCVVAVVNNIQSCLKLSKLSWFCQAAVECGFSVNKEVEVENMKQQTLVAHRVICDHIKNVEGILNVDLNKDLLLSATMSRQRYDAFLEQERQNRTSQLEHKKEKMSFGRNGRD